MTATTLGLNGQPPTFLGAYIKSITLSLGLSTNATNASIVLAEDPDFGVFFEEPVLGRFYTVTAGDNFSFGGIVIRFERDIRAISGRLIRLTMADPREIMRSIPVILAPGSQTIADTINNNTECSVLDAYGAFNQAGGLINLSQWNEAGMFYKHILAALNGQNIPFGDQIVSVEQQIAKAFGERYRFNLSDISNRVFDEYRINTSLVPISNIIEDLAQKFAFDWYLESERASDGVIDVNVRIIDRSYENIDISLQEFLDIHEGKVISATSGVELRNDISCLALQGAPVEQLLRVSIEGMANEPIDLVSESGTQSYIMTEEEMRVVIAGRHKWELWLSSLAGPPVTYKATDASGNTYNAINYNRGYTQQGYSRYGGFLNDYDINPLIAVRDANDLSNLIVDNPNIPKNPLRNPLYLAGAKYANSGRIYQKLKAHAEKSYGKRWVHSDIADDIIDSAWTRDAVAGNASSNGVSIGANDPNEFFRQSDGKTRAYVEFTNAPQGGAYSLGLNNLTNLFGDQDVFRNVTRFGTTYQNQLQGTIGQVGDILNLELKDNFDPYVAIVSEIDKSNYTYNNAALATPTSRTSLYVAASTDKDGVIRIDGPIVEPTFDPNELFNIIRNSQPSGVNGGGGQAKARDVARQEVVEQIVANGENFIKAYSANEAGLNKPRIIPIRPSQANDGNEQRVDADGNNLRHYERIAHKIKKIIGNHIWTLGVRAYQPNYAYIPVRSRYNRYGPVFSTNLGPESQGKIQIIQDDGFAPWEFGGASLMIAAMQLKVDNASSLQREIFSANISVENLPIYNIGQSLGQNSNISQISINFSDSGATTSYSLQTFVRKFGEFTKEDWARLALYANTGALKNTPSQQANFLESSRYRVMKHMTGGAGFPSDGGANNFG